MNAPTPLPDSTQTTTGDFLQQVRQMSIPRWLRWVILLFIATLFALFLGVFINFAIQELGVVGTAIPYLKSKEWLGAAGTVLAAVILPGIAVIAILFAESGFDGLTSKAEEILEEYLPSRFQSLRDGRYALKKARKPRILWLREAQRCLYAIPFAQDGKVRWLHIEVTLLVRKATVCILVPTGEITDKLLDLTAHIGDERADSIEWVKQKLPHSLGGAAKEHYEFLENLGLVILGKRRFLNIVGYKKMPDNYLWNPSEKLHFVQDLFAFIESIANEAEQQAKFMFSEKPMIAAGDCWPIFSCSRLDA